METKSCYLDSNICISYFQKIHPFHRRSVDLIKKLVDFSFRIILSPLVIDETIYILIRDARKLKIASGENKIKKQISAFFKLPKTTLINPPSRPKTNLRIFLYIAKYHLKPRDAYHLLIMKHHKIKYFATFDSDFESVFASKTLKQYTTFLSHTSPL